MKKMSTGKPLDLNFMDLGASGVGTVFGGVVNNGITKVVPTANPKAGSAVNIIGGFFLTRTKNRMLQMAGLGLFNRGFSDGANAVGIGDEAISEAMDMGDGVEAELAAELAAEMEAELAGNSDYMADDNGSI